MEKLLTDPQEFDFVPEENAALSAEPDASTDMNLNESLSMGNSPKEFMDEVDEITVSGSDVINEEADDTENAVSPDQRDDSIPDDTDDVPQKPKRTLRKKKDLDPEAAFNTGISEDDTADVSEKPKRVRRKKESAADAEADFESASSEINEANLQQNAPAQFMKRPSRKRTAAPSVLTIESKTELETQESLEESAWHEIRNAYRTRKILTGTLGGIEQTDTGKTLAIVSYNDFRIVIPIKEMMINLGRSPSGPEYGDLMLRQNKILGNMLGAEIDFIVKGIESKTRSVVASRKDAMLKKRQLFYLNTDTSGMYRVYEGRIVQARVIAVAEKVVRIEAFGVECSIVARDLSWDWLGDAHERFSVGDQILVRILSVNRNGLEDLSIKADVKSVLDNTNHENLKKCRVQGKYAGKVTDVHKGVVYIRLANGVNAIAHSCYDRRMPGKKDDVSFAVTHLDEERGVAVGLITRIIKQNL